MGFIYTYIYICTNKTFIYGPYIQPYIQGAISRGPIYVRSVHIHTRSKFWRRGAPSRFPVCQRAAPPKLLHPLMLRSLWWAAAMASLLGISANKFSPLKGIILLTAIFELHPVVFLGGCRLQTSRLGGRARPVFSVAFVLIFYCFFICLSCLGGLQALGGIPSF